MAKGKPATQWQKDYIKRNAYNQTLEQLSKATDLSKITIGKFCADNRIAYVSEKTARKIRTKQIVFEKPTVPDPPKKINRPPAVYGNAPSPYGIADELHNYSSQ
jgi:hypothetical protein